MADQRETGALVRLRHLLDEQGGQLILTRNGAGWQAALVVGAEVEPWHAGSTELVTALLYVERRARQRLSCSGRSSHDAPVSIT